MNRRNSIGHKSFLGVKTILKEEVSELQKVFLQVRVSLFLNYFDSKKYSTVFLDHKRHHVIRILSLLKDHVELYSGIIYPVLNTKRNH